MVENHKELHSRVRAGSCLYAMILHADLKQDTLFEQGAQLRRWDDEAKIEGLLVPEFESYVPLIRRAMVKSPRDAASCCDNAFYVREGTKIVGIRV